MRLGPLSTCNWGFDLRLPFGWWFVWFQTADDWQVYISNDATPPDTDGTRGFFLVNK